jgi:hypothetical protein
MVRPMRSRVAHPNARRSSRATPPRTCGTVNAGVGFFPPPRLLRQEPRRDQRQRRGMMPPGPRPHLVVPQPRFTLGPPQALFDPLVRVEHPRLLRQRRRQRRVRQEIIVLARPIRLVLTEHDDDRRDVRDLPLGACRH